VTVGGIDNGRTHLTAETPVRVVHPPVFTVAIPCPSIALGETVHVVDPFPDANGNALVRQADGSERYIHLGCLGAPLSTEAPA
jgi:hypothetical protein